MIVDKTGTLTEGRPRLVAMGVASTATEDEVLRFAAAAERASERSSCHRHHRRASERGIALPAVSDFHAATGTGLTATIDGHAIAIGNFALLATLGIGADALPREAKERRQER